MPVATISFLYGMNLDADKLLVGAGDQAGELLYVKNATTHRGVLESICANKIISYDVPDGENKVIGAIYDAECARTLFVNWNSEGNHGLYQFDKNCEAKQLYDCDFKLLKKPLQLHINNNQLHINQSEVVDKTFSGEPTKSIDLDKLDVKCKSYILKVKKGKVKINVFDSGTGKKKGWFETIYEGDDALFLTQINACNPQLKADGNAFIETTGCDCSFRIKADEGCYIEASGSGATLYPENHYAGCHESHYKKRQPLCPPILRLVEDKNFKGSDEISNKAWQLAYRYIFCNKVVSPLGTPSMFECVIESDCLACNENCLEITFKDEWITNSNSDVKYVEILARNDPNQEQWQIIKRIDRCDLTEPFRFYNDLSYPTADITSTTFPQNQLPDVVIGSVEGAGRNITIGSKSGYDTSGFCTDTDLKVEYKETVDICCKNKNNNKIVIPVEIQSQFANNTFQQQVIYWEDKEGDECPVYGGIGGSFIFGSREKSVGSKYGQYACGGGIPAYIAGKDHIAFSVQELDCDVQRDENGIPNPTSPKQYNDIRDCVRDGKVKHTITLDNLPPGKHIVRIANPKTGYNSPFGKQYDPNNGRSYQDTSMPVLMMDGIEGATEVCVEIPCNQTGEPEVVTLGKTIVGDLTDPSTLLNDGPTVISGYLIDANGNSKVEDVKKGCRVEKQCVRFREVVDLFDSVIVAPFVEPINADGDKVTTDHNGYYWGAFNSGFLSVGALFQIEVTGSSGVIKDFKDDLYRGSWEQFCAGAAQKRRSIWSAPCLIETVSYTNQSVEHIILTGSIKNEKGCAVKNQLIQYKCTSRKAITGKDGFFRIKVYPDARTGKRNDDLIINNCSSCCVKYLENGLTKDCISKTIQINNFSDTEIPVNNNVPFCVITNQQEQYKGLKKGYTIPLSIGYQDACGKTFLSKEVKDKEGNFLCLEYKDGVPCVRLIINHKAPEQAVKMQLLMPRFQGRYFQWVIGDVKYVNGCSTDPDGIEQLDETTFNGGANEVYLGFGNLITYNGKGTDIDGFVPKKGDKVRIISTKNEDGIYERVDTKNCDYDIKNNTGEYAVIDNVPSIEFVPGMIVEFYTPVKTVEFVSGYTTGQGYDVINCLHKGNIQNQTESQPAIIELEFGNTFYREVKVPLGSSTEPDPEFCIAEIESPSCSDDFDSVIEDIGFPYPLIEGESENLKSFIVSGADAAFNDTLTKAQELTLTSIGSPTGIIDLQDRALVVGKTGSQPYWIGQDGRIVVSPDGGLVVGTDVAGQSQELRNKFGSCHLNSFVNGEGTQWAAFDMINGGIWLYTEDNGQRMISDFGVKSLVCDLAKKICETPGSDVVGGYDEKEGGTYFWTFIGIECESGDPCKWVEYTNTLAFRRTLRGGSWFFMDFNADLYSKSNTNLIGFKNGKLSIYNQSKDAAPNYWGEDKDVVVAVPVNDLPSELKKFHSLEVMYDAKPGKENCPEFCFYIDKTKNEALQMSKMDQFTVIDRNDIVPLTGKDGLSPEGYCGVLVLRWKSSCKIKLSLLKVHYQ